MLASVPWVWIRQFRWWLVALIEVLPLARLQTLSGRCKHSDLWAEPCRQRSDSLVPIISVSIGPDPKLLTGLLYWTSLRARGPTGRGSLDGIIKHLCHVPKYEGLSFAVKTLVSHIRLLTGLVTMVWWWREDLFRGRGEVWGGRGGNCDNCEVTVFLTVLQHIVQPSGREAAEQRRMRRWFLTNSWYVICLMSNNKLVNLPLVHIRPSSINGILCIKC